MAEFTFESLKKDYGLFREPYVGIEIGGVNIAENKFGFAVSDVRVELSAGMEASMASFVIYNTYDFISASFNMDKLKKYIILGSSVIIRFGYSSGVREVFRGFISKVNFIFDEEDIPGVMVSALDIKGVMMANNSSRQLKAKSYSAAMKEILDAEPYSTMMSEGVYTGYELEDTTGKGQTIVSGAQAAANPASAASAATTAQNPAAGTGAAAKDQASAQQASDIFTVEMVAESDYEFFVRAAKRYNCDFFVIGGKLYFRKAKSDSSILIELKPDTGIKSLNVEYDITGLYGSVEVRNVDAGKGKLISGKAKVNNKISQGSKAKSIVGKLTKVYIDPTVESKDDATKRAESLAEMMSYRFATLEATMVGLPEMIPGKFITLSGMNQGPDNTYYLQEVIHIFSGEGIYTTKLIGKAAKLDSVSAAGAAGGAAGAMSKVGGFL
ncbi:MAG: phage late control D family protein [Lachnospiraceae bacterium]|nr:phage late control D family protein [Lachnospiraceae bacterium]